MKKYLVLSLVISGVLLLIYYLLNDPFLGGYLHDLFPVLILFFFVQSFVIAWMLSRGEKNKEKFPLLALGSVTFRFVSGVIFLGIFFVLDVVDPVPLSAQFLGVYLLYLIFEIFVVLANLRRN